MRQNQVFMGWFLKEPSDATLTQMGHLKYLKALSNEQLRKEALSVVHELYRDKVLTQYQQLLIRMAIEAN